MRHRAAFVVLAALTLTSNVEAASLEKARSLRQSGLQAEARKELAEIVSSEAVARADRAEALLLLGEMDVDEKGFDAARQHWQTVVASYPETKAASSAKNKLQLLEDILASIPAAAIAPPAGAESASPAGSVAAAVDAFFAAMRAGDLGTIRGFLADDYVLIGVGGNVRNKETRLAWLKDNVASLSTVRPGHLKIREYGEVAVVTGLVTITDETPAVYERFTHVWARSSGAWKMVSGQVTAVAPEHQAEIANDD